MAFDQSNDNTTENVENTAQLRRRNPGISLAVVVLLGDRRLRGVLVFIV